MCENCVFYESCEKNNYVSGCKYYYSESDEDMSLFIELKKIDYQQQYLELLEYIENPN